jgi:hypothetical protein
MFVDGTFNIDANWNEAWADQVVSKRWDDIAWYGFFRADTFFKEHRRGVFRKLVKAGLHWFLVGVERQDNEDYEFLSKHNYDSSMMRAMFQTLRREYPSVVRHATFLVGLPEDDEAKLWRLYDYAVSLQPDFIAFQTISPQPGTTLWNQALEERWLVDKGPDALKDFYWWQPVMRTEHLDLDDLMEIANDMNRMVFKSYLRPDTLRSLFSRSAARRGYYRFMVGVGMKTVLQHLHQVATGRTDFQHLNVIKDMVKPTWYEA